MKIKIIQTTTDSTKTAESISKILVKNNLSPCVQIIPNIKSVYRWKEKLEKTNEILLLIKTIPENVQQCKSIILNNSWNAVIIIQRISIVKILKI